MIELQNVVDAAQHQLGLLGIDEGRIAGEHPDVDASCSRLELSPPGEQRRPHHAAIAAENTGAPIIALVAIARARLERRGKDFAAEQAPARRAEPLAVYVERAQVYFA